MSDEKLAAARHTHRAGYSVTAQGQALKLTAYWGGLLVKRSNNPVLAMTPLLASDIKSHQSEVADCRAHISFMRNCLGKLQLFQNNVNKASDSPVSGHSKFIEPVDKRTSMTGFKPRHAKSSLGMLFLCNSLIMSPLS